MAKYATNQIIGKHHRMNGELLNGTKKIHMA